MGGADHCADWASHLEACGASEEEAVNQASAEIQVCVLLRSNVIANVSAAEPMQAELSTSVSSSSESEASDAEFQDLGRETGFASTCAMGRHLPGLRPAVDVLLSRALGRELHACSKQYNHIGV